MGGEATWRSRDGGDRLVAHGGGNATGGGWGSGAWSCKIRGAKEIRLGGSSILWWRPTGRWSACRRVGQIYELVGRWRGEANKDATFYMNKEVKNWEVISTIYSKDHVTSAGAKTGGECAQPQSSSVAQVGDDDEETPEPPKKRPHAADAILSMVGELRCTFDEALKTTGALPPPKVTPPSEILAALEEIPYLEGDDLLRAYGKLRANERTFESLMELPQDLRKPWVLTLP
ncbi:hypothetical protein ZWY2020_049246 [Hordeum vulgare]|nr:hypothetical protein ZWY2020_049246 [Hordeum vulgare]